MSDGLVEFLAARLDEEEHLARCGDQRSPDMTLRLDDDLCWVSVTPARVLADVEAKRRRLARHVPERRRLTLVDETGETSRSFFVCTWCTPNRVIADGQAIVEWPCPDVRDDTATYAGHPDYRQEWVP